MTTGTDWPYDAIQDDPLTALRIPVVTNPYPRWHYLVAFDLDAIDEATDRPDDRETAMLRSYLDRLLSRLTSWWVNEMANRPFDIDGGANGVTFRKWGPGDWGYRFRTWQSGPVFVPCNPRLRTAESPGPLGLEQVMDRIYDFGDGPSKGWRDWKAAHPEAFEVAP